MQRQIGGYFFAYPTAGQIEPKDRDIFAPRIGKRIELLPGRYFYCRSANASAKSICKM